MANFLGNRIRFCIFGESHGPAIGCILEGLPPGHRLDLDAIHAFLARRAPGRSPLATARREADTPEFLSGLLDGVTTGAPLAAIIRNADHHSQDYAQFKTCPRPGHADYTASVKYHGYNDIRGGGAFSGRLTAPLCVGGAIALQILAERGIRIGAHIAEIGGIQDTPFNPVDTPLELLDALDHKEFPVLDDAAGERMADAIQAARAEGDSVGGIVEAIALGLPAGLGNPPYDGLENRLAQAIFSIPAVKGVEFGDGFAAARLKGSQNNDPFFHDAQGTVKTRTNHCGGILGGISDGMPLLLRAAFKPTPSIAREQETVDLARHEDTTIRITGRHDPCIVPRAVPPVIAAVALTLLDTALE